jgi:hypothetical protein
MVGQGETECTRLLRFQSVIHRFVGRARTGEGNRNSPYRYGLPADAA